MMIKDLIGEVLNFENLNTLVQGTPNISELPPP
jgi:hypothetical protein